MIKTKITQEDEVTKWLTDERGVAGQNEAIFGITLLTQYGKVLTNSNTNNHCFSLL